MPALYFASTLMESAHKRESHDLPGCNYQPVDSDERARLDRMEADRLANHFRELAEIQADIAKALDLPKTEKVCRSVAHDPRRTTRRDMDAIGHYLVRRVFSERRPGRVPNTRPRESTPPRWAGDDSPKRSPNAGGSRRP